MLLIVGDHGGSHGRLKMPSAGAETMFGVLIPSKAE